MTKRKPITTLPTTIRIWRKIAMTDDQRECWLWTGGLMQNGYAKVGSEYREPLVHRVVYEMAHGPIPEDFQIDHLCRVRHCCNPFHLASSLARGTTDAKPQSRQPQGKTEGFAFEECVVLLVPSARTST